MFCGNFIPSLFFLPMGGDLNSEMFFVDSTLHVRQQQADHCSNNVFFPVPSECLRFWTPFYTRNKLALENK
jgi:hypothetical protein